MTNRPAITVAAVEIRDHAGRVLTVRKRGSTRFMHPGGKAEAGESPVRTAVREIAEELGLVISPEDLQPRGRFTTATANEPGYVLEADLFALAIAVTGDEVAPRAEIEELRWVRLDTVAHLNEDDCAPWAPLLVHTARLEVS